MKKTSIKSNLTILWCVLNLLMIKSQCYSMHSSLIWIGWITQVERRDSSLTKPFVSNSGVLTYSSSHCIKIHLFQASWRKFQFEFHYILLKGSDFVSRLSRFNGHLSMLNVSCRMILTNHYHSSNSTGRKGHYDSKGKW